MDESWGGLTADEIIEVWDGQVRPIPSEAIATAVSSETRRLLTEVGLPTVRLLGSSFVFDDRLSNTKSQDGHDYLVLTDEPYLRSFALDTRTDEVVEFDQRDAAHTRFVNTDLATLIFFLGRLWRAVNSDTNAEALAALDEIRSALSTFDPAAMEEGAPWWLRLDDLESQIR